jgi:chromosome segregation protein
MRLKRLELSGFKSFAKKTVLEFPAAISGIVGPNGSGKSNIVEGIRWALGEQAFKNLRGKKSEDFIFSGSPTSPRLGKASATLIFDPVRSKKPSVSASLPSWANWTSNGVDASKTPSFDYEEAIISRKVFRDGVNEYLINDSQVRLKDIVEFLGKIGLGPSSHHIISQGESDRILNASPKEKREMLEDALGLKIYQLKRQEAEKKLEKTEENINSVEVLRKEIQPHLKFLKKQAEKAEKAQVIREKLHELCRIYFSKKENFLKKEFERIKSEKNQPFVELQNLEEKTRNIRTELEKEGKEQPLSYAEFENQIEELRKKRLGLERDLGRCEGMIEIEEERRKEIAGGLIERPAVLEFIEKLNRLLKEGFSKIVFEKIKKAVGDFSEAIKAEKQAAANTELNALKSRREEIVSNLEVVRKEEEEVSSKLASVKKEAAEEEKTRRIMERELYEAELKSAALRNQLNFLENKEEELKRQKERLETEKREMERYIGSAISLNSEEFFEEGESEEAAKEIERLKIKLEDSEGLGGDVLKEYKQVKARDDFFDKELNDLGKAKTSLIDLMGRLSRKIDEDFKKGISDINREFQNFFALMFGGGSASLNLKFRIPNPKIKKDGDEIQNFSLEEEEKQKEEEEEGVEISVNLPRKRIHSLDTLSGGERALTSIALLFAMTRVNPPPFLVLDEVDAALDESNSQKYAKMLKDLSRRAQLILVTHNRETMKQADILYGVTMGSSGISQVLSVKFEEAQELAAECK